MKSAQLLLALLVLAGGAGAWNYQRNLETEDRPYQAYSQAQLSSLIGAYEAEVSALDTRYQKRKGKRVQESEGQLLDQRVRAFDQASRESAKTRGLAGDLSEREAALRDLRTELAARTQGQLAVHLRRLLTI